MQKEQERRLNRRKTPTGRREVAEIIRTSKTEKIQTGVERKVMITCGKTAQIIQGVPKEHLREVGPVAKRITKTIGNVMTAAQGEMTRTRALEVIILSKG